MKSSIVAASIFVLLAGCKGALDPGRPKTIGEASANYGYIPLDPLPVDQTKSADSCREGQAAEWMPIPQAFPDLATRFAVAEVSGGGQVTFGPAKVTTKGNAYRAILDYVNVDVASLEYWISKEVIAPGEPASWVPISQELAPGQRVRRYDAVVEKGSRNLQVTQPPMSALGGDRRNYDRVNVPIYIGIGLRLTADIRALEGGVNLTGLGSIGAQADAKRLTGTLTVQTLGINGAPIASALPNPSKLDQTTIENGILAIGTSRAVLYNAKPGDLTLQPRVVGLYSPIGSDPRLINALYSALSAVRVAWARPCIAKAAG